MPETDSSGGSDPGTNDINKSDKGLGAPVSPKPANDSSGTGTVGTVDDPKIHKGL